MIAAVSSKLLLWVSEYAHTLLDGSFHTALAFPAFLLTQPPAIEAEQGSVFGAKGSHLYASKSFQVASFAYCASGAVLFVRDFPPKPRTPKRSSVRHTRLVL